MEEVQKRMEIMSGEVEQMRRKKLFSNEQCKKILKIRKQFEYKISGFSNNLQDFRDYIEYEMGLLKTVRFRRNSLKIGDKMGDIEHKIINRIKALYEKTLQRFPDDTALCLTYFKFCKQANYVNAATVAVSNMIKNHSHNVEIWQVAAKWHAYDRNDINAALKVICQGLAKHTTSKLLYTEIIQLEIHNAVGSNWQGKMEKYSLTNKQKLCLEKLQLYIKTIFSFVTDCEYYVELLDYLEDYNFSRPIQNMIIDHLIINHSSQALTWNVLAQRDRKGLSNPVDDTTVTSTKMRLTKCIDRYKEGLSKVSVLEKENLWSLYINCIIDARQEDYSVATVFKTNSLKEAFVQASDEGYLFEKYYIQWLELADNHEKTAIMEKGIARFPESIELWKMYLRMEILLDNRKGIERVFKEGIKTLKEKALHLWTGIIRYHLLSSDDDTIEAVYKEGVKQPREVSDILKPQYIEWLAIVKDMKYTREQYFALANEKPYCKDLHLTMSKLESTEIDFDFDIWDKVHGLACEQFGKEDVEVWLNRIQYYIDYKPGKIKKEDIQQAYTDAQESLPEVLFLDFKDKYFAMTNKELF